MYAIRAVTGHGERIRYHDIGEKYSAFLKYTMLTVYLTLKT